MVLELLAYRESYSTPDTNHASFKTIKSAQIVTLNRNSSMRSELELVN